MSSLQAPRHWIWTVIALSLWQASPAFPFDHTYRALDDSVLAPFVIEGGVDYAALALRRASLDRFLADCAEVSFEEYRSFTRSEQMAFLINLYNAATLQLVLDRRPARSMRDLGGLFRSPWAIRFISLFGRRVSLGNILHDVLRPEFEDPRVHFALCNASRGSPALASEPYRAETLEEQLDACARVYMLERPEMNRWDGETLYLSPLFKWYSNDFGKTPGVRVFARKYFPDVTERAPIRYTDWDWSLNSR